MKKMLLTALLAAVMILVLAACGDKTAAEGEQPSEPAESEQPSAPVPEESSTSPEESVEPPAGGVSYIYEFQGMMGLEQAQFDFANDGTCELSMPGNPMITDVYAGTYTREGDRVTVTNLANVDPSSQFAAPGLLAWIVDGGCTITVDDAARTFVPDGEDNGAPGRPAPDQAEEIEGIKGVAYASGSPAQVCDIYQPEGTDQVPVIVLVHGGGFSFGDQGMDIIRPVIKAGLANGYAVVSVDYRKSSDAVFPAALADVKAAVRFVRANAEEYGFDPDHIAVWGESAGAYLSLMTALTPDVAELNGDVTDNAGVSSGVTALVSFYAPVEFYTMYEEAGKPESAAESFESKFLGQDITGDKDATYATYWETYKDQIPTDLKAWIQAGDSDQRVPCTQSSNFAQRLAEYLGEENVEHDLIPGADHEDAAFYTDENLSAVFSWLDECLKG